MKQTDKSQTSVEISLVELEDIPEALREGFVVTKSSSFPLWWLALIVLGLIGSAGVTLWITTDVFSVGQTPVALAEEKMGPEVPNPFPQPDNLLGHLPYNEVASSDLKPITPDGLILLHKAAADRFLAMQRAAQAQGIILQPLSGFRSVEEQKRVFFEVKEKRGQAASQRAEVSAPPGYSEHHTGYAIDIGDGKAPKTHLSQAFERTLAYQWLAKNAAYYSFELSFPKDNFQGVSYEPWHWRFVGDRQSLETFYRAKNIRQPIKNQP